MSDREDRVNREFLAHKLIAGTATQEERDNALATILLSLWTFKDLRDAFNTWHTDKCSECPAKKHAEDAENAKNAKNADDAGKLPQWAVYVIVALVSLLCGALGVKLPTMF